MGRTIIRHETRSVGEITEEIAICEPKNKNDYHAQTLKEIVLSDNFFSSGVFTKKEIDALFLHEVYHKKYGSEKPLIITLAFVIIALIPLYITLWMKFLLLMLSAVLLAITALILFAYLNRPAERSADDFSAGVVSNKIVIDMLNKLYALRKHNPIESFFYDLVHYSKDERLKYLANMSKNV